MGRNNGGFTLIKINKENTAVVTSADFDKSVFRKLYENKIVKPIILQVENESTILEPTFNTIDGSYTASKLSIYQMDGFSVDGYVNISIEYLYDTDELTYTYTEQ